MSSLCRFLVSLVGVPDGSFASTLQRKAQKQFWGKNAGQVAAGDLWRNKVFVVICSSSWLTFFFFFFKFSTIFFFFAVVVKGVYNAKSEHDYGIVCFYNY